MNKRILLLLICASCTIGHAQSLADTARQERDKEAAKESATTPKVITNDDLGSSTPAQHTTGPKNSNNKDLNKADQETAAFAKNAEKTKAAILAQETRIADLKTQIAKLRASIRYVETGVPLNQNQLQKQQAADGMQQKLDNEVKKLDAMKEAARRAGFGSVVYQP